MWDETEPTVCAEHAEVRRLADESGEWEYVFDSARAFLESDAAENDYYGLLGERLGAWHAELVKESAEVSHDYVVAKVLADRDPDSRGPADPDARKHAADLLVRSTSLGNAYANLIENRHLSVEEHRAVIRSVGQVLEDVDEEHRTFWKREGA